MNPAASDWPKDLAGGLVGLAKYYGWTKNRDRHMLGPMPGRKLAGQLAAAIMRHRRRHVALQSWPLRVRRSHRRQRRDEQQHRRRRLRGTRLGHIGDTFAIDAIEILDMNRLDQAGQMIDRIVARRDPSQRRRVRHVADNPANRQSCQTVQFRRLARQAAHFVALIQQCMDKVKPDEATRAGYEYFSRDSPRAACLSQQLLGSQFDRRRKIGVRMGRSWALTNSGVQCSKLDANGQKLIAKFFDAEEKWVTLADFARCRADGLARTWS